MAIPRKCGWIFRGFSKEANSAEVGISKRKQENKETRKQELDQESEQENKRTRPRKKEKTFL